MLNANRVEFTGRRTYFSFADVANDQRLELVDIEEDIALIGTSVEEVVHQLVLNGDPIVNDAVEHYPDVFVVYLARQLAGGPVERYLGMN